MVTFDDEGAAGVDGAEFVRGVTRVDAGVGERHVPEWERQSGELSSVAISALCARHCLVSADCLPERTTNLLFFPYSS